MAAAFLFIAPKGWAWSPGNGDAKAVSGFTVNRTDRRDVLAFHNTVYNASEGYAGRIAWTGNMSSGRAGTTSAEFQRDVLRRINYYRALCGLPADIIFNDVKSAKCQEAALVFSASSAISHYLSPGWTHYTANAAEAAKNSNIAWGSFGPGAIDGYIEDEGGGNSPVGHRRWILYSRAREMGTGDIPPNGSKPAANALWNLGNHKPAPTPAFVAWPNDGFSPANLVPNRWSLSHPNAYFGLSKVSMTRNGTKIPLKIVSTTSNYGDNTIVWETEGISKSSPGDQTYRITVSNMSGQGVPSSHSYTVTLFDPWNLGESVTISGPAQAASGASFPFHPIAQADAYQLRVGYEIPLQWSEDAEDSTTSSIAAMTSGSYPWRQNSVKRSGEKAFYLAFPKVGDPAQVLEIQREILPGATSSISFHELFRFATKETRLSLQASRDGGLTWSELWGRNGKGSGNWMDWDQAFQARSISLSAYAGQPTRLRFVLSSSWGVYYQANFNDGVFLDDISFAGCGELIGTQVTNLPATAKSFVLNANTAGGALVTGRKYHLRIRPQVGTVWFGDGPIKTVTAGRAGPEITVLGPGGVEISSGGALPECPPALLRKPSAPVSITIRNDGDAPLTGLVASKAGAHRADFLLGPLGNGTLAPGATTSLTVSFAPAAGGNRTAQVNMSSNDADEKTFAIRVSGYGLSPHNDRDSDGVSDAAEHQMAALGFDWRIRQPEMAQAFLSAAHSGGLLLTNSPVESSGLGLPLLSKNPVTGKLEVSIGLRHSRDQKLFNPLPLNAAETSLAPDGTLKIQFTAPSTSKFFRIETR